jgi:hypothetical protein
VSVPFFVVPAERRGSRSRGRIIVRATWLGFIGGSVRGVALSGRMPSRKSSTLRRHALELFTKLHELLGPKAQRYAMSVVDAN